MSRTKILDLTLRLSLTSALIFIMITPSLSQEKNFTNLLEFRYGFHFPLADMKDRFGSNSDIGVSFENVNSSQKVFFGADATFFFGNVVREDVLAGLRTFDGSIIGIDGYPGDVNLKERGFYLGLNTGKIFPTGKEEKNLTGFRAQLGAGLLQHKIRVQDNFKSIVALEKRNLKGYDRLTNGPAIHFAAGFHYQHPKNNFHFNIMSDLYAARTRSRRDFDNPTGGYLSERRTDILAGITIAYVVSISNSSGAEHIYY